MWIVTGFGTFEPPLRPATIDTVEKWEDGAWVATATIPGPLGIKFITSDYRRVTATVGTTDGPPDDVVEAFRRLSEYLADDSFIGRAATSGTRSLSDQSISSDRPATWQAKALHYSGAADLLRRYR